MANFFRKIYDATSKSDSKFGKFGKWIVPFNAPYITRDLWRKYGKKYFSLNSAAHISMSGGGSDIYGPTGSIVGKY